MGPLLFISHKHSDEAIADVVAKFIGSEATMPVRVFMSSNPQFEGPKFGKDINRQLRSALWEADALILIYTMAEDQDWSWCMWECGVANDAGSPETSLIVFQCGSETPKIFSGSRLVNVRKLDELQAFLKQYFTDPGFYPGLNRAFAPYFSKEVMDKKALDLYNGLKIVLPEFSPAREWPTWPFLRVELPLIQVERIKDLNQPMSTADQIRTVTQSVMITTADSRALEIFGLASLNSNTPFSSLATMWKA